MVNYQYDLNLIFHCLSDPTRRAVLEKVSKEERRIGELAQPFKMSLAAVSKHLKVLEAAGLIKRRKQGREVFININREALMSVEEWLSSYESLWSEQFDTLENFLETNKNME